MRCCLIEVFHVFNMYSLKVGFFLQILANFFVVDGSTKLRSGVQQPEPGILSSYHHLSAAYSYGDHPPDVKPDQSPVAATDQVHAL